MKLKSTLQVNHNQQDIVHYTLSFEVLKLHHFQQHELSNYIKVKIFHELFNKMIKCCPENKSIGM